MKASCIVALLVPIANSGLAARSVEHPEVPCWLGQASGAENDDFVSWDTVDESKPYLITHERDHFKQGGQLEQDSNFITYWFGNPGAPIQARHYLGETDVSVLFSGKSATPTDASLLYRAVPEEVMCYLQKRFDKISVLGADGYVVVWKRKAE